MSEMKRPCLDYAALPDVPVSEMAPAQQLICKLAWIGDNAAYGVEDAVKRLIDDVRAGVFSGWVYRPTTLAKPEALRAPTAEEISAYRDTFRTELDKRMDTAHPSASPSTESHAIALRRFVENRNK